MEIMSVCKNLYLHGMLYISGPEHCMYWLCLHSISSLVDICQFLILNMVGNLCSVVVRNEPG